MERYGDVEECLDGPQDCAGEVLAWQALSGSGFSYVRCTRHYDAYVARLARSGRARYR